MCQLLCNFIYPTHDFVDRLLSVVVRVLCDSAANACYRRICRVALFYVEVKV